MRTRIGANFMVLGLYLTFKVIRISQFSYENSLIGCVVPVVRDHQHQVWKGLKIIVKYVSSNWKIFYLKHILMVVIFVITRESATRKGYTGTVQPLRFYRW